MSQQPPFRSLNSLSKAIVGPLRVIIVCLLGIPLIDTVGCMLYPSFTDPNAEMTSPGELALGLMQLGLVAVNLLLTLVVIVSVWRFMHRANSNLRAKGVSGLEFTPGWCIGWWFVPFANLVQPRNAMAELYKASSSPANWRAAGLPSAMNNWWACWIAGSIASRAENRLVAKGVDLGMAALPLSWASSALMAGAAIYLISVVISIRDMQNQNVADLVLPQAS